jgi:hypothetical protein
MKQRNDSPTKRIRGFHAYIFVPIAPLTGKGQVREIVQASTGSWYDVLYDEGVRAITSLATAVLATPESAFGDGRLLCTLPRRHQSSVVGSMPICAINSLRGT